LRGRAAEAQRYASSPDATMKVRAEVDDWRADGPKILSPQNLEIIRNTLENEAQLFWSIGIIVVLDRQIDSYLMILTIW
jgi:hypothetical protein